MKAKPYQPEIPTGGQHCKALSTADHDFKGAYSGMQADIQTAKANLPVDKETGFP